MCREIIAVYSKNQGPASSVGIATGYGLNGPGIVSRWGQDFPHPTRPALGPTQPPGQWVPGLSRGEKSGRGVTLTPHPLLVTWSWKGRAMPLLPLRSVRPVQSLSACTRVTFTLLTLPSKANTIYFKIFFVFKMLRNLALMGNNQAYIKYKNSHFICMYICITVSYKA